MAWWIKHRCPGRAAPEVDSQQLLRRARSEFDARRPLPAALAELADAIAGTPTTRYPDRDDPDHVELERLAAAVEYLDAATRVAPELLTVSTVEGMAHVVDQTTAHVRTPDLLVEGARLSAAVSLALLTGQPALGIAHPDDHRGLMARAHRLVRELQKQQGDIVREEDLWALHVVGDALDAAGDPEGRSLMRLADRVRAGSAWTTRQLEHLQSATVDRDEDAGLDLGRQIARLRQASLSWNTVGRLPEIAAQRRGRHRYGRGLLGEHARARAELDRPLYSVAAMFVSTVLLAVLATQGPTALGASPVRWDSAPDLAADDALAMSTALLAVSGAVAIALAVLIAPDAAVPFRYEAARRWWTVGLTLISTCGVVSVAVGVAELLVRAQSQWWAATLTLGVGALNFLLAAGIDQWQDEARLRGWRERSVRQSIHARLQAERSRVGGTGARSRWWLPVFALAALPAGSAAAAVLVSAALLAQPSAATTTAVVAAATTLGIAVFLLHVAVEWRRLALVDPAGSLAQLSLALTSTAVGSFLFVPSILAQALQSGGLTWWGLAIALGGCLAFLLVVISSRWSAGWPTRFVRRRALLAAERSPPG